MRNDFDIRIHIEAKVLPREYYENMTEQMAWEKINHAVQHQANILAESFKNYLEYVAKSELTFRINAKEIKERGKNL